MLTSVYVRRSSLKMPPPDDGLFAARPFKKGEKITCYATPGDGSVIYEKAEWDAMPLGRDVYGVDIRKRKVLDARESCHLGKRANTNIGKNNAAMIENWWSKNPIIYLRATKNIKKDQEVFVAYGHNYKIDERA